MITKENINRLADSISSKFHTQKIYLFGSYAENKQTSDSDIDICIVADLQSNRKLDLLRAIRNEIYLEYEVPIDILLYDVAEFAERAALNNTLEYKIANDGYLIHG